MKGTSRRTMQSGSASKLEERTQTRHKQASDEIIGFLEDPQGGGRPDLPQAVIGHWQDAVTACKKLEPDWNAARIVCDHAKNVLAKLRRDGNTNIAQVDGTQGRVLILLGVIYLGKNDLSAAIAAFQEAAIPLRSWSYKYFESLAHFGEALTHRKQQNWREALVALQKALDAVKDDFLYIYRPAHLRRLEERIKQELAFIPKVSIEEESKISNIALSLHLIVKGNKLTLQFYFDRSLRVEDFHHPILPTIEAINKLNQAIISLTKSEIAPNVAIEKVFFSSPLEISLGEFIPQTIEVIRQFVKDLKYRNEYERQKAQLEVTSMSLDLAKKYVDLVAPPNASTKERSAIVNQVLPHLLFFSRFDDVQLLIEDEETHVTGASAKDTRKSSTSSRPRQIEPQLSKLTQVPIVSDIAAGLGRVAEEDIEDYLSLEEDECRGADFAVRVVGDSMKGHGILPGDIALIRQQSEVETGEIAAVVIITPEIGSEGVLKQYYAYEKHTKMGHWFLRSSNPSSEHLVVIPSGAKVDAIRAIYDRAIRSGGMRSPIKYYENSDLFIAGKYVGLVRNI